VLGLPDAGNVSDERFVVVDADFSATGSGREGLLGAFD
jgi:hypothetical protein